MFRQSFESLFTAMSSFTKTSYTSMRSFSFISSSSPPTTTDRNSQKTLSTSLLNLSTLFLAKASRPPNKGTRSLPQSPLTRRRSPRPPSRQALTASPAGGEGEERRRFSVWEKEYGCQLRQLRGALRGAESGHRVSFRLRELLFQPFDSGRVLGYSVLPDLHELFGSGVPQERIGAGVGY